MAGDWIKMRIDLQYGDPHVVRIMSALHADKLRVIGALHAVWCLFDQHSTNGQLSYAPSEMDLSVGWEGFSQAMIDVGWLEYDGGNSLTMHNFNTHNGKSAKRRASESLRRQIARNVSASHADTLRTRGEEIREEKEGGRSPEAATRRNGSSTDKTTPSGLHDTQYAARLIEEISMPSTQQNIRQVAAGIKAEESQRGGLAQAYEFVLGEARAEIERKGTVTGFWFQDAKWREKKIDNSKGKGILGVDGAKLRREAVKRLGAP